MRRLKRAESMKLAKRRVFSSGDKWRNKVTKPKPFSFDQSQMQPPATVRVPAPATPLTTFSRRRSSQSSEASTVAAAADAAAALMRCYQPTGANGGADWATGPSAAHPVTAVDVQSMLLSAPMEFGGVRSQARPRPRSASLSRRSVASRGRSMPPSPPVLASGPAATRLSRRAPSPAATRAPARAAQAAATARVAVANGEKTLRQTRKPARSASLPPQRRLSPPKSVTGTAANTPHQRKSRRGGRRPPTSSGSLHDRALPAASVTLPDAARGAGFGVTRMTAPASRPIATDRIESNVPRREPDDVSSVESGSDGAPTSPNALLHSSFGSSVLDAVVADDVNGAAAPRSMAEAPSDPQSRRHRASSARSSQWRHEVGRQQPVRVPHTAAAGVAHPPSASLAGVSLPGSAQPPALSNQQDSTIEALEDDVDTLISAVEEAMHESDKKTSRSATDSGGVGGVGGVGVAGAGSGAGRGDDGSAATGPSAAWHPAGGAGVPQGPDNHGSWATSTAPATVSLTLPPPLPPFAPSPGVDSRVRTASSTTMGSYGMEPTASASPAGARLSAVSSVSAASDRSTVYKQRSLEFILEPMTRHARVLEQSLNSPKSGRAAANQSLSMSAVLAAVRQPTTQ